AAARLHAGVADVPERVQPVLELAGVDDLVVELRRGVEVVVVVVQAGITQGLGLLAAEHAQGGAGLQPERLHPGDHRGYLRDVPVLGRAPGRAHAEPAGPGRLRLAGL